MKKMATQTDANKYGLPVHTVFSLASMLGKSEDFDGLISALEDAVDMMESE
jgi:hypothetical protein